MVVELSTDKKVYVINGSGGVGKDTFVMSVLEHLNFRGVNISSITPIKQLASQIGWTGGKTEKDRKFLSDLKDLCTNYNDYPMQYLRGQCKPFLKDEIYKGCKVMFMHIREPKEIQKAVDEFGAKTILVLNNNVKQIVSNHADDEVYSYRYDMVIDNSGSLEQLKESAKTFCEVEKLI